MEIFLVCFTAFAASILTFFSGFGLGTLLTPVFMLFFDAELAIALTGIVHFFNNLMKLVLVGKHADKSVLVRFGIPAVIAALFGSYLMIRFTSLKSLFQYSFNEKIIEVFPLKFMVAVLLIIFSLMELIPYFKKLSFNKKYLPFGGMLSGFFGGLSGNQGALRAAFLIKAGLSKEAFVGTAVVVSSFVDFTRLGIYATHIKSSHLNESIFLVVAATLSAMTGAFIGNKLFRKITLNMVQNIVALFLLLVSVLLALGIV
ncbi:MAG TPA: sulfite exporter TauE/SafE family protein [Bacteroidia bacterium]|nr:sulfite exporter TauE/SafE family protein [Bacteroidia bacterium]HNT80112.1 sulfite exporter TauE/SafE family protein [Bacteroidia bacterium]